MELTLNQALQKGVEAHKAGKAQEADRYYTAILKFDPEHADANHNMGVLAVGVGKVEEALTFFEAAIKANPNKTQFWLSYIDCLLKLGWEADAKRMINIAIRNNTKDIKFEQRKKQGKLKVLLKISEPNHGDPPEDQLQGLQELCNTGDQQKALLQVLKLRQSFINSPSLNNILGILLDSYNKLEAAIEVFDLVIRVNPNFYPAYNNLGNTYKKRGQLQEALKYYKKAIYIKNDFSEAYKNIGVVLNELGDHKKSIEAYLKAIQYNANFPEAYYNMGNALRTLNDSENAIKYYRMALSFKPKYFDALNNMGVTQFEKGDIEKALTAFDKALKIKSDEIKVYNNIGNAHYDKGDLDTAILFFKKALLIKPNDLESRRNLSFAYLSQKNFKEGWYHYQARSSKRKAKPFLFKLKPVWKIGDRNNVLLWSEQGIGDIIMFASIVLELYESSDTLIMHVDERLIPLFQRSFPKDIQYYSLKELVPEDAYDTQIPFGSLPGIFRPNLKSFSKGSKRYLKADESHTNKLRRKNLSNGFKEIIGITWKGGSKYSSATSMKSVPLNAIVKNLPIDGIKLLNLQYGNTIGECEESNKANNLKIYNESDVDNFKDIDGLAALISACDYVVSVDNLTVHLSGALGVPTKVLLPLSSDWRWAQGTQDSYWHSSLTLFRQEKISNWDKVLNDLYMQIK